MIDIHSHILPGVDDGAAELSVSLGILTEMKKQGITEVIATPHFYAMNESIEEFEIKTAKAYQSLKKAVAKKELPRISIGSEIFYFNGIGRSEGIRELSLCGSKHILLELPNCPMDEGIIRDIKDMYDRLGLITVLAHLERYSKERGFKNILKLIDNETVFAQVNASSLFEPKLKRAAMKLIKNGYASFLATDSHSLSGRPPMMKQALELISNKMGSGYAKALIRSGEVLRDRIFVVPGEQKPISKGFLVYSDEK